PIRCILESGGQAPPCYILTLSLLGPGDDKAAPGCRTPKGISVTVCCTHRDKERDLAMDFRVFITTLGIIFLAEMGDKTQLAAMTMAAQTKKPWAVFLGASIALAAVSALGVLVGSVIGNYVPIEWVKRVAAVAFIVIGVLMLLGKF